MISAPFAGIAPSSVPPFVAAQVLGGILAAGVIKALYPAITPADAAGIIVPHSAGRALPGWIRRRVAVRGSAAGPVQSL